MTNRSYQPFLTKGSLASKTCPWKPTRKEKNPSLNSANRPFLINALKVTMPLSRKILNKLENLGQGLQRLL